MESYYRIVGGATIQNPEETSAGHDFELFWINEQLERLVRKTNIYARQEQEKNPPLPYAAK